MSDPTRADAARILAAITGKQVSELRRFPNGLAHFVFDARLSDGEQLVIRLTRPEHAQDFSGAVYWHARLVQIGIPLPALIHAELDDRVHGFPVLVLERLPGVDLGDCYPRLSTGQKRGIASRIVELQRRAGSLPAARGFGYAHSHDDPELKPAWVDVLEESLERTRSWTRSAGVLSEEPVDRVAHEVERFNGYFGSVQPVCFLHDTTTKNVIVNCGELSGIVDVDSVCFGDPLWVLALTNMAMLSGGFDREYVDAWAGELNLNAEQRAVLSLYTAMHCVTFLSEIGQRFNKESPLPVDPRRIAHLQKVLEALLVETTRSSCNVQKG